MPIKNQKIYCSTNNWALYGRKYNVLELMNSNALHGREDSSVASPVNVRSSIAFEDHPEVSFILAPSSIVVGKANDRQIHKRAGSCFSVDKYC